MKLQLEIDLDKIDSFDWDSMRQTLTIYGHNGIQSLTINAESNPEMRPFIQSVIDYVNGGANGRFSSLYLHYRG